MNEAYGRYSFQAACATLRASPCAHALTFGPGTILYVNRAFRVLWHVPATTALRGRPLHTVNESLTDLYNESGSESGQTRRIHVRHDDGAVLTLDCSTRRLRAAGSASKYFIFTFMESPASYSRSTEQRLREWLGLELLGTRRLMQGLIDSVAAPIYSIDRQLRYTSFNKAHRDMTKMLYGVTPTIGASAGTLITHPDERLTFEGYAQQALMGMPCTMRMDVPAHPDGAKQYDINYTPLKDERGTVNGIAVVAARCR